MFIASTRQKAQPSSVGAALILGVGRCGRSPPCRSYGAWLMLWGIVGYKHGAPTGALADNQP